MSDQPQETTQTMKEPTIEEIQDQLTRLKAVCEALCRDAEQEKELREKENWCVNWADFGVVRAMWFIDDSGDEGFSVDIEEASSDNWKLGRWIQERLEGIGFDNVEINFNW